MDMALDTEESSSLVQGPDNQTAWIHYQANASSSNEETTRTIRNAARLIHLDLKGAPPKVSFYAKLFPLLHQWGATGLLIEYEDMFPYEGELKVLAHPDAYNKDDIKCILQLAQENSLAVIPLIQTFGHFEFVLKHDKFFHLREVERYPDVLCPSNTNSFEVLKEILKQVVALHPGIKYIHIGLDEVWHMGQCNICQERMKSQRWNKDALFLHHASTLLQFLKLQFPWLQPVMWDDMLRYMDVHLIKCYNLGILVEPMVWYYEPGESWELPEDLWKKYCEVFSNFWVATSFKGATGSCAVIPIPQHHISNHKTWVKVLSRELHRFKHFQGFVLTGWARYNHFATLCELLPTGIPSLLLCLRTLEEGDFSLQIHSSVSKSLGLSELLELNPFPRPKKVHEEMSFPGSSVCIAMESYVNMRQAFNDLKNSAQLETWFNPWQIRHNHTNPEYIEGFMPYVINMQQNFLRLRQYLVQHMTEIFYSTTIEEWLCVHIDPRLEKLREIIEEANVQIQLKARVHCQKSS